MIVYKIFYRSPKGVLGPWMHKPFNYTYSLTEPNKRLEGHGPFGSFINLWELVWFLPGLVDRTPEELWTICYAVEAKRSDEQERMWDLEREHSVKGWRGIVLIDEFTLIQEIDLQIKWEAFNRGRKANGVGAVHPRSRTKLRNNNELKTGEPMRQFKTGEIILFTSGEYSDYGPDILIHVLRDFTSATTIQIWAEETHRKIEDGEVQDEWDNKELGYLAWLTKKEFIKEIEYREENEYCWSQPTL